MRGSTFSERRRVFALATVLVASLSAAVAAQDNAFSLTGVETIPGQRVSIFLSARLAQPARGFSVGVAYPRRGMTITGVSFKDTVLEGVRLDVFEFDASTQFATLRVLLDDRPPLRADIPEGSDVALARLDFEMNQGLEPGEEFAVELRDGLGFPPVPALVFTATAQVPVTELGTGIVRIIDDNVLKIDSLDAVRPGDVSTLGFTAFNLDPLQGFTIGMTYDPAHVRFLSAHLDDTITEAVGAEFVDPFIDNDAGELILGVLLDVMPPFQNQLIPASGLALTIAKADFVVQPPSSPDDEMPEEITLSLVDGLGKPPKKNIFTIDNFSVLPRKEGGVIRIEPDLFFLRGDAAMDGRVDISDGVRIINFAVLQIQGVPCQKACDGNDDGRIDLADVVYILNYLFRTGSIIPQPFPQPGFDPTPDALTCESSADDYVPRDFPVDPPLVPR